MLHDHSGFDRHDPDHERAIEDALEPVAELLIEKAKAQPRDAGELAAWRGHIGELRSRIRLVAERGGIAIEDLEREAERRLRRQIAARALPTPEKIAARAEPAPTFGDLAEDMSRLSREIAEHDAEIVRINAIVNAKSKQLATVRKKLFRYGRKLG